MGGAVLLGSILSYFLQHALDLHATAYVFNLRLLVPILPAESYQVLLQQSIMFAVIINHVI